VSASRLSGASSWQTELSISSVSREIKLSQAVRHKGSVLPDPVDLAFARFAYLLQLFLTPLDRRRLARTLGAALERAGLQRVTLA
jgi:hypothetical protein